MPGRLFMSNKPAVRETIRVQAAHWPIAAHLLLQLMLLRLCAPLRRRPHHAASNRRGESSTSV
jgi:hypothetical protein